ncbi:MAG TPA: DNA mismatch repair protein MutS [Candidatus Dormibacteraeota bacterium]
MGAARPAARPTLSLAEAGATPILREYRAVKAAHPGALLLARLGDFFELFGEDAELAAPILGVILTGRAFGGAGRLPMCGVPAAAATQYIGRLLAAGHRVVLWDQIEDSGAGRGLVRREVTRVLSPGTVLDEAFLEPETAVRCVALWASNGRTGVAALDASSGDLQLGEVAGGLDSTTLAEDLERLQAAEVLLVEGERLDGTLPGTPRTALPVAWFDSARGAQRLREATGTATLAGFDADRLSIAHAAAAALLAYCERSRIALPAGFLRVRARAQASTMSLDAATRRNLELLGGLVGLLDRTRTPMGARLLRARLQEPLLEVAAIEARLATVAALHGAREIRAELRLALARVRDLERLVGRCVHGLASPRDVLAVAAACEALPRVAELVSELGVLAGEGRNQPSLAPPPGLAASLRRLLVDDPPATLRDGGAVRAGADAELDGLRGAGSDARSFIATLEERERARTGIRSLKVGYNRVFGYYIEIPNAHREMVPADYHRKQTLVGAERYITPVLKEQEAVVLGARERSVAREVELVAAGVAGVADHAAGLLAAAGGVAGLDVAQALAEVADEQGWCRPAIDASLTLEIEAGRHPLVEAALPAGAYVANDCALVGHAPTGPAVAPAAQLMIITGPNMAGKSTYLRQVALTVLLAQVGSFVPARSARIGVCDRIFTRVGAHDDLAAGLSTFMVEMTETAAILNTATSRSLVVLDEIGRGTSTYDGLSIAQAVVEYLHDAAHLGCRTLFATHYHELTALSESLARVRNARVEVVEEGDAVTFLHRIVEGGADRSYGIHVARLAGVPGAVVARARRLLAEHEQRRPIAADARGRVQLALPLASAAAHPVVEELERLDLDGLTPLQALNKLAEWHDRVAARPGGPEPG